MTAAGTPTMGDTTEPEREIVSDMLRRGLPALPLLVILGAVGWGLDGALSAGFAIVLVLANLALSAALLSWSAKRSPTLLMAAALGGFSVRMVLLVVAVALVKDQWWFKALPLGIAVLVTHVGLLVWESRHVSVSLAYPGLKPRRTGA